MNGTDFARVIQKYFPVLVADQKEALKEHVDNLLVKEPKIVDRERFNIILTFWPYPPCNDNFFDYYFPNKINSIQDLEDGLETFVKDSLWYFGDIKKAYLEFRNHSDINSYFRNHAYDIEAFKNRLPWSVLKKIKPEERGYLGYVSGERPKRERDTLQLVEKILIELEENQETYSALEIDEVTDQVINKLSSEDQSIKSIKSKIDEMESLEKLDLFSSSDLAENKRKIAELKNSTSELINRVEELKRIGEYNQEQYLKNIENIDVYVATSMRDDKEYHDMYNFVAKTFEDENLKELNLRYFDPTLCFCESRIDKGIIECLLVRTAKVTIYCAQEGDTFGKDSELAATLCQGKPAIIYVPQSDDPEKKEALDKRAKVFKEFHPLGLQVGVYDGVARGVIVVRSPESCARILYKILTNDLDVDIVREQHGTVLRESETNSVVRVMSGWNELSNAFWNNFDKSYNPKTGRPD